MKKTISLLFLSALLIAMIGGLTGCKSTSSTTLSDADKTVMAYADPATEITLQGLSEDNLAKYIQYGDTAFKAALTQAILDQTSIPLKTQVGDYVSKTYLNFTAKDGYILVYYSVKYTKTTLKVQMTFDTDHMVAGQFFVQ